MSFYVCLLTLLNTRVQRAERYYAGGHTNTERGYLKTLRQKLVEDKELGKVSVEISEKDAHPLRAW